jgi:hypothetical protein
MEFEKSIFRVHERILKGPTTKDWLKNLHILFLVLAIFSLVNLVVMHSLFVDDRSVLKP